MSNRQATKQSFGRPGGPGGPFGAPVGKAKNFKGTFRRLVTYFKPQKFAVIVIVLFAILSTFIGIRGPKILGEATTKIFSGLYTKMTVDKISEEQVKLKMPPINKIEDFNKRADTFLMTINALKQMPNAPKMDITQKQLDEMAVLIRKNGGKIDFGDVFSVLGFLLSLYALSALFGYIQQYITASVTQKIVYKLRSDVSVHLSVLPLKFYDSKTHGEILSRVTNDIGNISNNLQQSFTQIISAIFTLIGILYMMFTISPILSLIALISLPVSTIFTIIIAKKSQKQFAKQQKSLGELNGHTEEMFSGHNIIKAFGKEDISNEKFCEINDKLYESSFKAQFISGVIMPVMSVINNIGYVLICVVGGIRVINGQISIGDIQAFIQYSRQFMYPIMQTANIANIIQSTIVSAERVFELLDEKQEVKEEENPTVLSDVKGNVDFENVKFGYSEDKVLMENLNISIKEGQTIAIVGPTGAGKTTIVNLLMRFYEVNDGAIYIDGADITKMKRSELRKTFGMVLQDTWLFNGTIKENIAYGRENANDEEIFNASKAAYSDHFIRTLPDGYETVLNEEATNISQGQKQLLTIARAVLADPRILILDEATSSVDTRTELLIQKAMHRLMQGRTSFVIAHRLSTIKDADLILVLNDGHIIEKGTHKELLEQNGFYFSLYNSQFKPNS